MHSSSGRASVKLLGAFQAAFCKRHIVLIRLLLAPIVSSGTACTAAVIGYGRCSVNESGE